jgi:tripartite-type tricarboxylate transporter receptor subunit TctC
MRDRSFVIGALLAPLVAAPALAQNYPNRPVRLIVALAAGGSSDVVARVIAARLSEQLGQQVVIDNRPGAGGSVGWDLAAHAPADGYTLFFAASGTLAIAPNMLKLGYDAGRDLAPVSMVGVSPFAMMVHPSMPVKSVPELITLAKARPGKINFGSSGQGSTGHLAWELFKLNAKVNLTHVPYRGSAPALVGIISGEIDAVIFGVSAAHAFIRNKQVRVIAVTSAERMSILPEVPAIAETLPGFDVVSWYGLLTTAGTPAPVIAQLHQALGRTMATPEVIANFGAIGVYPEASTPEQLAAKMREETAKWGRVIKAIGLKAE